MRPNNGMQSTGTQRESDNLQNRRNVSKVFVPKIVKSLLETLAYNLEESFKSHSKLQIPYSVFFS